MYANYYNQIPNQNLTDHLTGTMHLAMYCAKHLGLNEELTNIAGLCGFLHDVGKCTNYFQNVTLPNHNHDSKKRNTLIKKTYPKISSKNVYYPRHNEISWAFTELFSQSKSLFSKIGGQAIYWHHGTLIPFNKLDKRDTNQVINELNLFSDNEDQIVFDKIWEIIGSVKFPFDISKFLDLSKTPGNSKTKPLLFEEEVKNEQMLNSQRLLIRSCVIFADHKISSLSSSELKTLIKNANNERFFRKFFNAQLTKLKNELTCPEGFNSERFDLQKKIVNSCEKTTVIKAPAGFGKSLIGVLWGLNQSGQIYWVCPRNTVAEGVYENILKEIKTFNLDISVELFLASERVKSTHDNDVCTSNIIVTNIDNLLSPMVSYKATNRLFDINANNIVFDEFHEFVNDEALFGAFIVYMRARNRLCGNDVKTLLLSATPSTFYQLWDSETKKTLLLPDPTHHYPAQHEEYYKFTFTDKFVTNVPNSSLTMYSAIRNVQANYQNGYSHIIHSKYSDNDRHQKMSDILALFGKGGNKNGKVISAPILQAALDISFNSLNKTIESPECDIQTLGRVNRWGEVKAICNVNMISLFSDDAEKSVINSRYEWQFSKEWAKWLESNIKKNVTLDDVYKLYNEFNIKFNSELTDFFKKKNQEAIKKLSTFYPKQTFGVITDSTKKISAKTLRNSSPNYFIVVKDTNGNWCNFTFNVERYELDKLLKDVNNSNLVMSSSISTVWANLEKIQDQNGEYIYDYSDLNDYFFNKRKRIALNHNDMKMFAKNSSTPLPISSSVYNSIIGLH